MTSSITLVDEPEVMAVVGRSPSPPGPRRLWTRSRPRRLLARLVGSLAVILSVITLTFLVTRVFAPDPTNLFLAAAGNGYASAEAQAEARDAVRTELGLDESLPVQYVRFLGEVARGDLGESFQTGRPVTTDLTARLTATAELAVYSLAFGITLGAVLGVLCAVRRQSLADRIVRIAMVGPLAIPQFWIGLMLLWIFYTRLRLAPGPIGRLPAGIDPPGQVTGFYVIDACIAGEWSTLGLAVKQLVLPVLTLGLGLAAPIFKVVRTSMVEALTSDYVRTARALGFTRWRISLVYTLKNGLLPVMTVLAGIIAYTFSGSILVEGVFGWTGLGNYSLQAIQTSDFPAIQGFVVYGAILYVVIYESLDVVYTLVDPRVRL